mgnify:FL=1
MIQYSCENLRDCLIWCCHKLNKIKNTFWRVGAISKAICVSSGSLLLNEFVLLNASIVLLKGYYFILVGLPCYLLLNLLSVNCWVLVGVLLRSLGFAKYALRL